MYMFMEIIFDSFDYNLSKIQSYQSNVSAEEHEKSGITNKYRGS